MLIKRMALVALAIFAIPSAGLAQPTYKLGVKPDLVPLSLLRIEGQQISRTEVRDDPGFRLQYNIMKDGKPLAGVDARATPTLDLSKQEPGIYLVRLELFYPTYKTGTVQKGGFGPISNALLYRAYRDASGQLQFADTGPVRNALFYGLAAGKLVPVPDLSALVGR